MTRFAEFTQVEQAAVDEIVRRAQGIGNKAGIDVDAVTLNMDLSATHAKVPLRLEELAEADDFNFSHDVFGIMRHIDRKRGRLGGCFVPRFAR